MALIRDKIKQQQYITKANQVEDTYGLPRNILVGLMKTESNFNPNAKSSVGALGLMQFMPATAKEFGINPLNPSQSIDAAGKYLANNYKKLGNWDDTLRSYNMGLGNVYKWKAGKINLPKETAEYVGKVYKNMGNGNVITMAGDQVRNTIDNYTATTPAMGVTAVTPQISNLNFPLGTPNLAESTEQQNAVAENEVILKAKMELQQKQNEENLFNDLLKASQLQYVDPNQVQDYAQQDAFQQMYQKGGIVLSKDQQDTINKEINFNKDWFARRKNTFDIEGNPIPVEEGIFNNVGAFQPEVKTKEEMGVNFALFHPKTGITDLRTDFSTIPGTVAHERTHQYETAMSPENWNKYVNLPSAYSMSLDTLQKSATGTEDDFTKYMRDPSEIHSFIQEVRYLNNLDPTKPVTDEMVKELKYDKSNPLKDYYSDQEIKNFLNSMVYNQPSKSTDIVAQNGGRIVKDDMGYWNPDNWGKAVEINSPFITMKGVNEPLYIVPDVGEPKVLFPNQEYIFPRATKVVEYPLKNKNKRFI